MHNFVETDLIAYYDTENEFDGHNERILTNLVKVTIVLGMIGLFVANPVKAELVTKVIRDSLKPEEMLEETNIGFRKLYTTYNFQEKVDKIKPLQYTNPRANYILLNRSLNNWKEHSFIQAVPKEVVIIPTTKLINLNSVNVNTIYSNSIVKLTSLKAGNLLSTVGLYQTVIKILEWLDKNKQEPSPSQGKKSNPLNKFGVVGVIATLAGYIFKKRIPKPEEAGLKIIAKDSTIGKVFWFFIQNPIYIIVGLTVFLFRKQLMNIFFDQDIRSQTIKDITTVFKNQQDYIQTFSQKAYHDLVKASNSWATRFYTTLESIRLRDLDSSLTKDKIIAELRSKIEKLTENVYNYRVAVQKNQFVLTQCQNAYEQASSGEDNYQLLKKIFQLYNDVRQSNEQSLTVANSDQKTAELLSLLNSLQYVSSKASNVENFVDRISSGGLEKKN
jgi:hypothetical protein